MLSQIRPAIVLLVLFTALDAPFWSGRRRARESREHLDVRTSAAGSSIESR